MPRRVYPASYLTAMGLILLLSFVLHASFFQQVPQTSHLAFFFLGQDLCWSRRRLSRVGPCIRQYLAGHRHRHGKHPCYGLPGQRRGSVFAAEQSLPGYLLLIVSVFVGWWLPVPAACPRLWRAESGLCSFSPVLCFSPVLSFLLFFLLNAGFRVRCR